MLDRRFDPERAGLGAMLRLLRQPEAVGRALMRRHLAGTVRRDSQLFNELFLKRASKMVDTYLNEATHSGSGLDRSACKALRSELLEDRMLQDLLACVQAPNDGNAGRS